ncbi:MAG: hypothetical protein ACE5ID_11185, partial [Acidobacteriota bacterium]
MRQDSLIRHIWARNKYAVMARSRSTSQRITAMVESDPPLVQEAIELIAEALATPPTRSGWNEALEQAWKDLKTAGLQDGYNRAQFVFACMKGQEEARRFLFAAAAASDHQVVIGSSLLDDTPRPGVACYLKGR